MGRLASLGGRPLVLSWGTPFSFAVVLGDALYIYRFEIMILLRVKAKSLLCYWAVRDLGIGMAQIARRLNLSLAGVSRSGYVAGK